MREECILKRESPYLIEFPYRSMNHQLQKSGVVQVIEFRGLRYRFGQHRADVY